MKSAAGLNGKGEGGKGGEGRGKKEKVRKGSDGGQRSVANSVNVQWTSE